MAFVPQGVSMGTTAPHDTMDYDQPSDSDTFQSTMASFADHSGRTV
jgi:hypothetical protein